jgi:hypothetical protein
MTARPRPPHREASGGDARPAGVIVGDDHSRRARQDALFIVAIIALSLFRNGLGRMPRLHFYAVDYVGALPGVPRRSPIEQWQLWSPLGPMFARVLGVHSVDGFTVLHGCVLLVGFCLLVIGVRRTRGSLAMRVAAIAFVTLPISVVLQSWVGSYDAWIFLFATAIVVCRSREVALVAGFGLALANFEQGLVIVVLLTLVAWAGAEGSVARCAASAIGLGSGRVALGVWLQTHGVRHGRLDYVRHVGFRYPASVAERHWVLLALGLLGVGLPLIVAIASSGRRECLLTLTVVAVAVAPMLVSTDETRVYALITWAPLLALAIGATARDPERLRRVLGPTLALAVMIPGWFVWFGRPFLSDFHWLRLLGA